MSRQYDEYMEGKFEVYGELYELVEPDNFEELMKALQIKDVIQTAINGLMHDEDSSGYCDLLQQQEEYIQEYLDSIGEFDNSFLVSNINYLAKKNNLRIGEVESMLGLSAGYISRTAKENSAKKLSIDVVWKFARLFEVDLKALISTDLQIPDSNTDLASKFLSKVYKDTESGLIEWKCNGGVITVLEDSLADSKLFTQESKETIFHSMFLSHDARFILTDDVFACENITENSEVLIIPFRLDGSNTKKTDYEFVFRHSVDDESDPRYGTYYFKRFFTTADDPFGHLEVFAEKLYSLIKDREYDTRLSAGAKSIMTQYLKGEMQ